MDVIALANAGIADVVAPLGTALTEMQLEMLWRMVEVPILCFDGDAAGQRAAMRAIARALPLLGPMRSLAIVRLPAGLDPDDLIKAQGKAAMEALLASPASLIDTLWTFERDAQPLATPEAKAGLKARLMAHVETIADPEVRSLYRRELSDRFSAFAYPPRPARNQGGPAPQLRPRPGQRGAWKGAPVPLPGLSEEARARLGAIMAGGSGRGSRRPFSPALRAFRKRLPAMPRRFPRSPDTIPKRHRLSNRSSNLRKRLICTRQPPYAARKANPPRRQISDTPFSMKAPIPTLRARNWLKLCRCWSKDRRLRPRLRPRLRVSTAIRKDRSPSKLACAHSSWQLKNASRPSDVARRHRSARTRVPPDRWTRD